MQTLNFITKEELLNQLESQVIETGIWWSDADIDENGHVDFSNLEGDFIHLTISSEQVDFMKIYGIDLDTFCKEYEVDFVSQTYNGEIEFIHVTKVENLESIKYMGLLQNENVTYIPDLGEGIYAVDAESTKGLENLKTYLSDFSEEKMLLIKGIYTGKYNYCIKGQGHEGYIVFHDKVIPPSNLSFEIIDLNDFFFEY